MAPAGRSSYRAAAVSYALAAAIILGFWAWRGTPIPMPATPLAPGERLYCVSYTPFGPDHSPFDPLTRVSRAEIERDLINLAKITNCVRTYAASSHGHEHVPELAETYGLGVLQGIWIGRDGKENSAEIEAAVALAKRFPRTIRALIVGNEVLLRKEQSAAALLEILKRVKARVPMPVTYADVWEFWRANPALAGVADFITIHILPYWEDTPTPVEGTARHVVQIHHEMARAFPGKDIVIGEVGWPSAGRMRDGALPSRSNQARALHEIVAVAKHEGFKANLIEAFDQPWKRAQEGTVGGHWGVFDSHKRGPKFSWGEPVSDHPHWPWQAAAGIVLASLVFVTALTARRRTDEINVRTWFLVGGIAAIAGSLIGWTLELVTNSALGLGGIAHAVLLSSLALAAPISAAALVRDLPIASFAEVLGWRAHPHLNLVALAAGAALVLATLAAIQSALALVFDPRYREFPFAALLAAVGPLALLAVFGPKGKLQTGTAEVVAAVILAASSAVIVAQEGLSNWQALWFSGAILTLAFILVRAQLARG